MKPIHLLLVYKFNSGVEDHEEPNDGVLEGKGTSIHAEEEEVLEVDEGVNRPKQLWNMKKNLLYAIFSSANLCFVFGVCWSATKWNIPLLLDTVLKYNEFSVIGVTLFSVGILMRGHPFFAGCEWKIVVPLLFAKHVFIPCLAAFWSWVLKLDSLYQRACTLLYAMPVELTGVYLKSKSGSQADAVTFTAFWSQIIALPLFLLWVLVFNEAKLFAQ